jgi:hypothetical protein
MAWSVVVFQAAGSQWRFNLCVKRFSVGVDLLGIGRKYQVNLFPGKFIQIRVEGPWVMGKVLTLVELGRVNVNGYCRYVSLEFCSFDQLQVAGMNVPHRRYQRQVGALPSSSVADPRKCVLKLRT